MYKGDFEPIELIKDNLKVRWDYEGEYKYDPKHKKEQPVMRLNVYLKAENGEWVRESVCTNFYAKAFFNERYRSLVYILYYLSKGLEVGRNLKHMLGEISTISEDTMKDYCIISA